MPRSLRIAVADDESDMRDYLATILPHLGHEVAVVARTGYDLVAQCRQVHPDLLIADIKCPTWTASTPWPRSTATSPCR